MEEQMELERKSLERELENKLKEEVEAIRRGATAEAAALKSERENLEKQRAALDSKIHEGNANLLQKNFEKGKGCSF